MDGVDFETKIQGTFTRQKVSGHAFFSLFYCYKSLLSQDTASLYKLFLNFASLRARESVCSLNAI